jgi:hypothetical protein
VQFGAMLSREGQVGQHVVLALIHQCSELGPAPAQLVTMPSLPASLVQLFDGRFD